MNKRQRERKIRLSDIETDWVAEIRPAINDKEPVVCDRTRDR